MRTKRITIYDMRLNVLIGFTNVQRFELLHLRHRNAPHCYSKRSSDKLNCVS